MKRIWLMSLMVFAIALAAVQPAFAANNWDLNIHNNTEDTVKVNLTGPKNYSFDAAKGKMLKTVEEGDYKYSYTACGEKVSGEITVEDDQQWLVIENCGAIAEFAKFVVDSHLPSAVTVSLVGPATVDLQAELGSNKYLSVQVGWYAYSYEACGSTYGGELRVPKNGTGRLTLWSCEVVENHMATLAASNLAPANVRIGSHYAFPVRMTLLGPRDYSYEIAPGLNRLNLMRGDYSFFYVAYGVTRSGTFTVGEASTSFIISPIR
jgi:hypothetical protein